MLLPPLKMPVSTAMQSDDQGSAVSTPFAVPLQPDQLLPRLDPLAATMGSVGPLTASDTLLEALGATPRPSIMGPRPAASAPAGARTRLSKLNGGICQGPVEKAQSVLLRSLGVITAEEHMSPDALDAYLKLFDASLSSQHIRAVAALFDPDGVAFDEPAQEGLAAFKLPENVESCGA
ncbi:uncharacterized protein LOC119315070 [Triticum dicoccoides]|uniref:uncharacterized protein LOC119315070 n=1 Tax=Triticum dicoccoides TaxID=85692 RepID=UPI001890D5B0|nr:uncharacterized protein LOC119315070 [Triticum dicoccoides]